MEVAALLVRWLTEHGHLPAAGAAIRYASSCSGIDAFAAAAARLYSLEYMHAAEWDAAARRVLSDAWALPSDAIMLDARSPDAAAAAEVDLYVLTPDCVNFSKRRHGRDAAVVADGGVDVASVLGFVRMRRARVVIVENVDDADGVGVIDTALHALGGYAWVSQRLCPLEHAGQPVRRERRFWVGVRA